MSKVICGDHGDNIKALIRAEHRTKSGKTITNKVSDAEWDKVKRRLNIRTIDDFKNNKELDFECRHMRLNVYMTAKVA